MAIRGSMAVMPYMADGLIVSAGSWNSCHKWLINRMWPIVVGYVALMAYTLSGMAIKAWRAILATKQPTHPPAIAAHSFNYFFLAQMEEALCLMAWSCSMDWSFSAMLIGHGCMGLSLLATSFNGGCVDPSSSSFGSMVCCILGIFGKLATWYVSGIPNLDSPLWHTFGTSCVHSGPMVATVGTNPQLEVVLASWRCLAIQGHAHKVGSLHVGPRLGSHHVDGHRTLCCHLESLGANGADCHHGLGFPLGPGSALGLPGAPLGSGLHHGSALGLHSGHGQQPGLGLHGGLGQQHGPHPLALQMATPKIQWLPQMALLWTPWLLLVALLWIHCLIWQCLPYGWFLWNTCHCVWME